MPIIQPAPAPQIQSSSQPQSEVVEAQVVQEPETTEEVPSNANDLQNNPPVAASEEDIVADPGLRIPIEQMDPNIRDAPRAKNFGVDAFTVNGFRGWKDGRELIDAHSNGIDHNKSRRAYEDLKNQRQSVAHVINRGGKKSEEEYRGRLLIILGVIRFLLLQAHAFRGHDESSSSSNKGNFLEMVEWYKAKDKNAATLLRHNQMTSPEIQKDMCRACADLTTKAILTDLGDRPFAILVDEARDASIKEQMVVVLRYVNARGQVIERFLGIHEVPNTSSSSLKNTLDEVLENIAEDTTNGDKRYVASGLLKQMETFEFVLVMFLMIRLLGKTNDLSQCLQKKDQNIIRAVGLIGTTLQLVSEIIVEMNNRFAERSTQLLRCIACLDPRNSFANYDRSKILELFEIYKDDFSSYELLRLGDQIDHFIALTLPVVTATVERAFSVMKFVKNELRNKMGGSGRLGSGPYEALDEDMRGDGEPNHN
ncbi:uncharacterized protein [Miscanthus floridulus]|uniref:uncharacterized protein n=1 Tax=Miscanthus floridulus TaxID=154761 RepID=UPI0034593FBE